ncbi:cell death protein 3-like [Limulus polyphemus]|uniref:Cell death protein 3-like n=1 Tax=Limulus polyphemus TaxID=6850 RepID=A0ABM1B8K9_LIMPO|nr:cell death protein 3-like [Limulus polyphemus]XP_022244423.1 cell death protein 3-like [Limulus polyphemus]XP_022244424.1 cell death protein 3-like [Limulus polyphemus]
MDPDHREILRSNFIELSKVINLKQIVPFLLEKQVFTEHMMEDILAENTEVDQKHKLLLDLPRRGPDAFEKFFEILVETGHYKAALILEPNLENAPSSNAQLSTFINLDDGLDTSVNGIGHTQSDNQGINQLRVIPATKWREDSDCYKMSSCPRGYCLIINNVDFQKLMDERYGSEGDARKLNMVFHELGFEVTLKTDQTSQQMIDVIEAFSKKPEHEHVNSCVVIILSHGEYDIVYGTDAEEVQVEKILDYFNNESCPLLQGKPKMFFFQACRGKNYDIGVSKYNQSDAKLSQQGGIAKIPYTAETVIRRLPTWTDMLISYSTIAGYISLRNNIFGSWYCQALASVLMTHAHDVELTHMLLKVDKIVKERVTDCGEKQATETLYRGWSNKLYFNPGLYK